MRRWWESGGHGVEDEARWIAESSLEFALDEQLLRDSEVVAFRGQLRLGDERSPALLIFPPAYLAGEHPVVQAPELDLGRHRSPEGFLCLTHDVLGEHPPMFGAEAIERAEKLWWLWVNDREQLAREEADAPDPWANYVRHTAGTALTLVDVDVGAGTRGYIRLGLTSLAPLRGGVKQVRITHPSPGALELAPANRVFAGEYEVNGVWRRLDAHPPGYDDATVLEWIVADERAFVDKAIKNTRAVGDANMPALIGFVYPDEGPERGQWHDTWLFVAIRPNDAIELPRPFSLRDEERWLRQPLLRTLADKSVACVGVGALGSQVVDLLARAGVGRLFLVDPDIVTVGNRVRNELDLADLGQNKAAALAERVKRVNPWCEVDARAFRFGGAVNGVSLGAIQRLDDQLCELIGDNDLIVNATTQPAAGSHISRLASASGQTVIHSWVSAGAWGGRILRQRPGQSGCWDCLALAQKQPQAGVTVPPVSEDPEQPLVMERGCADPTFTGPGFELTATAAAATRLAVQTLAERDVYPDGAFDLATLTFRDGASSEPTTVYTRLPVHPDCPTCS